MTDKPTPALRTDTRSQIEPSFTLYLAPLAAVVAFGLAWTYLLGLIAPWLPPNVNTFGEFALAMLTLAAVVYAFQTIGGKGTEETHG